MNGSLPSLTALRVFEVAARLKSFSNAAAELHVTQGAVSRQIRALENELGILLFHRLTRRVELTDAGAAYFLRVQAALDDIRSATVGLKARQQHTVLTISVLPSLGSFWLMSRLARFSQSYPQIETRIVSSIGPVDLQAREADIAIRVGALPGRRYPPKAARVNLTMVKNWEGVVAEELAPDVMIPVYSKALGLSEPLSSALELSRLPLIHTSSRPHAWSDWASAYGLPPLAATPALEFGHFFMSMEAAREGAGVAIVPDILLADAQARGFIQLTQFKIRSAAEYYVLMLAERKDEMAIRLFSAWMIEQFEALRATGSADA